MNFIYEARSMTNDILRGDVSAKSPREAVRILREQGLFALRVLPAAGRKFEIQRYFRRSHTKFAMGFFRRLSVMLKTGFSLNEALISLSRQEASEREKAVLADICRTVQSGGTLESALQPHEDWFPPASTAFVRAGEVSGTLDGLLAKLADSMRKEYGMKEKRMTLLAYPLILLIVSFFAAAFLLIFVFPMFVQFFSDMHAVLPLPTRIVLGVYGFFRAYGIPLFAAAALVAAECARRYRREGTRKKVDGWLLRLPLVGRLILEQESSKIAGTLAALLESGMVLDEALFVTSGIAGNACLGAAVERAAHDVKKGFSLSSSLEKARIFPAMFMSQIRTGEEAGAMTEMLAGLETFYAEESDERAQRLHALIEPSMVLAAGCVVGTLVFAIALPVLDMMTSIGG